MHKNMVTIEDLISFCKGYGKPTAQVKSNRSMQHKLAIFSALQIMTNTKKSKKKLHFCKNLNTEIFLCGLKLWYS